MHPRRGAWGAQAVEVIVEGEDVEAGPQEFQDGYGEDGDILGRHREVPVEAVSKAPESRDRDVRIARVGREEE